MRAREALGWRLEVAFTPADQARRGRLVATLTERGGASLAGARVTARLVRPTHAGFDRTVRLDDAGGGRYLADVALPLRGLWEMRVHARLDGHTVGVDRRIRVP